MPTVISNESDSSEESEEEKGTLFYNTVNKGKARDQKETKEEKRARKELVKQEKRNRRESKKATKVAFQTEKGRQTKLEPNHKLLKNSVPL
jgi:protein LTV1